MSRAHQPTDDGGIDDKRRESLERLRDKYDGDVIGDICETVLQSLDNREVNS